MCLGVFLASDSELPLIAWNVEQPGFNVSGLLPLEESVRKYLQRPHVYAMGSHTHCGCGFQRNEDNDPSDVMASRMALASYVTGALEHGPADLFVCWNGETPDVLEGELTLAAADLLLEEEWLVEGTLTHLSPTRTS